MEAVITSVIGLAAGTLTTISFAPQAVKTWRTKSARDLSLIMFLAFCAGVFLWGVYEVLIRSWPVILANVATFALALSVLVMKIRFR